MHKNASRHVKTFDYLPVFLTLYCPNSSFDSYRFRAILEPIASSVLAQDLPLLPFTALQDVFKSASLDTEAGQALRRNAFDRDIIELLVNHLGKLCFQETAKKHSVRKA